jgi:WD40 repeat protein
VFFRPPGLIISLTGCTDWQKAAPLTVHEFDASTGTSLGAAVASDDNRVHVRLVGKLGEQLVLGLQRADRVRVWDVPARKLVREFSLSTEPPKGITIWDGFAASPDGHWIAVRQQDKPLSIHDATTGAVVATLPVGVCAFESLFLPDRPIYLTPSNITRADPSGTSLDVVVYDVSRKAVLAVLRGHGRPGLKLAASANGRVLVTGDEEGNILLWDLGEVK